MKNAILSSLLLLAAGSAFAADGTSYDENERYRSGEFSLDAFGTGSIGKETIDNLSSARLRHDVRLGAGLGLNYFFTKNFGLGAEAYSENPNHTFVDSASANLILRFPLGNSGFAPYAMAGGGHQQDPSYRWFGQATGGIEYRFTPKMGIFTDVRYVFADGGRDYGVGRLGLRFAF